MVNKLAFLAKSLEKLHCNANVLTHIHTGIQYNTHTHTRLCFDPKEYKIQPLAVLLLCFCDAPVAEALSPGLDTPVEATVLTGLCFFSPPQLFRDAP